MEGIIRGHVNGTTLEVTLKERGKLRETLKRITGLRDGGGGGDVSLQSAE
jgi:hypothetical protein